MPIIAEADIGKFLTLVDPDQQLVEAPYVVLDNLQVLRLYFLLPPNLFCFVLEDRAEKGGVAHLFGNTKRGHFNCSTQIQPDTDLEWRIGIILHHRTRPVTSSDQTNLLLDTPPTITSHS